MILRLALPTHLQVLGSKRYRLTADGESDFLHLSFTSTLRGLSTTQLAFSTYNTTQTCQGVRTGKIQIIELIEAAHWDTYW